MAENQIIGHELTHHTEPFIAPNQITVAGGGGTIAGQLSYTGTGSPSAAQVAVAGAVAISRTKYKNAISWGILETTAAQNATDLIINPTSTFFRVGDIIEYAHATNNVRLYKVTATNPSTSTITIDPGLNLQILAGGTLRTTGRMVDVSTVAATRTYATGEIIVENMAVSGAYGDTYTE